MRKKLQLLLLQINGLLNQYEKLPEGPKRAKLKQRIALKMAIARNLKSRLQVAGETLASER